MKHAIAAPEIFDGVQFLSNQAILIEQDRVVAVVPQDAVPEEFKLQRHASGVVAPGFIDWQVNGGGGALFNNDTTVDALEKITNAHHKGGTTTLLPTIVSDTQEKREQAVAAVTQSIAEGNRSVGGIHLEGPFFSPQKRGVHQEEYLRAMTDEDVQWLCSLNDSLVLVTLAPEHTTEGQIRSLSEHGVIVSAGHSNADSTRIKLALDEGLTGFTHLYNAMRPAEGREPGVVGSALLDNNSWCGIIVDGHHVHEDMVRLAHRSKPTGKLCLVTDAMATIGSENKSFELYGTTITEQDGRLINHEGRLAGAAIAMIDAVRLCNQSVGIELSECLRMASLYPSQFLGIDTELGRITEGHRADMVIFDENFNVQQTWVAGQAML